MSLEETFNSNLGNYTPTASAPATAAFDGTLGNPSAGCAKLYGERSGVSPYTAYSPDITNNTDTHLVAAGESLYFNARLISSDDYIGDFTSRPIKIRLEFSDASPVDVLYYGNTFWDTGDPLDTGWLQFPIDLASREGKTCNFLRFLIDMTQAHVGSNITMYVDSVDFATSPPAFNPNPGITGYGFTRSAGGIPGSILVP